MPNGVVCYDDACWSCTSEVWTVVYCNDTCLSQHDPPSASEEIHVLKQSAFCFLASLGRLQNIPIKHTRADDQKSLYPDLKTFHPILT